MAGWDQGWALGSNLAQQHTARKQQLQDEERQLKAEPIIAGTKQIQANLPQLESLYGKDSQQYKDASQKLVDYQQAFDELYHPIKAPGAIARDFHWLAAKVHGINAPKDKTPSSTTSQTPEITLPTPAAPLVMPELPAYQQTTLGTPAPGRKLGSPVTTNVPGVPAETLPPMPNVPKGATPTMAVAKPQGLVEAGNIPIWNRPSVLNDDGTHSSELSISMQDDKGNEVLIPLIVDGKFLTPNGKMPPGSIPQNAQEWDKASPEWKALRMRAWQHYQKTGQHLGKFDNADDTDAYAQVLHNRGSVGGVTIPAGPPVTVTKGKPIPWAQGQVQKLRDAAQQKAQQEAGLLAAGAPLSPSQTAQAQSVAQWARLDADMKAWDQHNPDADKDDRQAVYSQLYEKYIGTTGKGSWDMESGTILTNPDDPDSKRIPATFSHNKIDNQLTHQDRSPVDPAVARTFIPDAKSANVRPLPYYAGAVNLDTARKLQSQGKVYNGEDGNPLDLSSLPDGSDLVPVFLPSGKSYWSVSTDKGRYETGDNLRKFEPAVGGPVANPQNVGQARVGTVGKSVTPGPNGPVVTTSVRSPVTGGAGTTPREDGTSGATIARQPAGQQGTRPAAPRSGVQPTPAKPTTPATPPKQSEDSSEVPPLRDPKLPAMKGADERAIAGIAAPVATVEQQVMGRGVKPLWDYSGVLNNPDLLKAVNLAMSAPMIQTPEGSKDPGFWETVTRALGLTMAAQQVTTEQITATRKKVQKDGGSGAVEFLDRLAELKGTLPNLRKIQGGSSAMGAMQPLYQESPIMNISSPEDFRNRTANMLRTIAVALNETPGINKAHVNWLYGQADQAQANSPDKLKKQAALMNAPHSNGAQSNISIPAGASHTWENGGKTYYTDDNGNVLGEVKK